MKMTRAESNDKLPSNLMAMITLPDLYNEPVVNIAHREDDNDDTAVYSLVDYRIVAGELSSKEEEDKMRDWVRDNADYLLDAWNCEQLKIITMDGFDD